LASWLVKLDQPCTSSFFLLHSSSFQLSFVSTVYTYLFYFGYYGFLNISRSMVLNHFVEYKNGVLFSHAVYESFTTIQSKELKIGVSQKSSFQLYKKKTGIWRDIISSYFFTPPHHCILFCTHD
jgi:hypothetical protein